MSTRTLRQIRDANPYPCERMSLAGPHPVTYSAVGHERLQKITCTGLMHTYRPRARTIRIKPRRAVLTGTSITNGATSWLRKVLVSERPSDAKRGNRWENIR